MSKIIKIALAVFLALLVTLGLVAVYVYFIVGKSVPQQLRNWFPTGGGEGAIPIATVPGNGEAEEYAPLPEAALVQISRDSVSGAGLHTQGATSTVLYVERETGNFFSFSLETNEKTRLTNVTLPRVQEAIFSGDGSRVALRYLSDDGNAIETFVATVPRTPELEAGQLQGSFLPKDILHITGNPMNNTFFYLTRRVAGGVAGFITATGGDTQIWNSPLLGWVPRFVAREAIALQTSASGMAPGYLYTLNPNTRVSSRVTGDVMGFTALVHPNLTTTLYSRSEDGWLTLSVLNAKNNISRNLPIRTLPEKCLFSTISATKVICAVPNEVTPGIYPDLWYRGEVSFSDSIWLIDIETDELLLLADFPRETESPIDIIDPLLTKDEQYMVFRNKRDGGLWRLKLPLKVSAPRGTSN